MQVRSDRIALIGDLHSSWDDADVGYFNRSAYELLLLTGDLGATGPRDGLRIASSLARLERRTLIMPGNNDAEQYASIAAELTYRRGQAGLLGELAGGARVQPVTAELCGYSTHAVESGGLQLTIIAGRPFAMGGDELSFAEQLERIFGVRSLADSAERLCALVDAAQTEHVVFFAHNGPTGLGSDAAAIWGCDFRPGAGDWGDTDLATAIAHARSRGRKPVAVIAGHMHWSLKVGGMRRWQLERDGTLYVNAARVPRIVGGRDPVHHHIALRFDGLGAHAEEVLVG